MPGSRNTSELFQMRAASIAIKVDHQRTFHVWNMGLQSGKKRLDQAPCKEDVNDAGIDWKLYG